MSGLHRVLRVFEHTPAVQAGDVIDTSGWPFRRDLLMVEQRYLEPVTLVDDLKRKTPAANREQGGQ